MNGRLDGSPPPAVTSQGAPAPATESTPVQMLDRNEWSIELLRGIAALMVILSHYWTLMGIEPGMLRFLFTGVDLFFVISGFVFAPYLFGRNLSWIPHLIRRFFRIYPLYLVSLFIYAALRLQQGLDADHFVVHLFFLNTIESRDIASYYNIAFWSLPPEVEFYLALPLLAFMAKGLPRLVVFLAAALVIHVMLAYASPLVVSSQNVAGILNVHLPGLLVEFLLGAIAWWVVATAPGKYWRAGMLFAGIIYWLILASVFAHFFAPGGDNTVLANAVLRGNLGLLAAIAYALIVAALVGWEAHPPAWARSAATTLGNLSFGLYLFHNAAPVMLRSLKPGLSALQFSSLCLVLTVLMAALLHLAWERPLRGMGRTWAKRYQDARRAHRGLSDTTQSP